MKSQDMLGSILLFCAISAVSVSANPVEKRLPSTPKSKHLRPHYLSKRDEPGYAEGNPIDGNGKGAPILGGTDKAIDIDNPANLGQESTDAGTVKNLKWRFSDSKTRQLPGGWVREQVITDLPASHDIAGAQQHLTKNSIREMHWHRVAEWGYVYHGQVAVSAVDEDGRNQVEVLNEGDIWYFPKGEAHVIQGLADQNEYLLVFDDGDFEAPGTSFNVDDWIAHTPKEILAKSLGIDPSLFASVPSPNPYILKANSSADLTIGSPYGKLEGNSSYVFKASEIAAEEVPGGGGTVKTVDSRNFPVAQTIASSIVTLKPGALRELHWHPNAEEWLYFLSGSARATVFVGNVSHPPTQQNQVPTRKEQLHLPHRRPPANLTSLIQSAARTFDFSAGDTAVFPDNAGHYVQNTSPNETLSWIEIYKSDRVVDISLTQWLALTPAGIVADTLKIPIETARGLRKEKQVIIA
ncbi:hypothetical protein Q7P36_010540 [Cladosporium allicinum]